MGEPKTWTISGGLVRDRNLSDLLKFAGIDASSGEPITLTYDLFRDQWRVYNRAAFEAERLRAAASIRYALAALMDDAEDGAGETAEA